MAPRLCFLNVQPHSLLVGQPGGFLTEEDFYKFAAQECGFTGVTMPSGFVNILKAIADPVYRETFQAVLHKCGLTDGLVRMEMHVTGQCMCIHPSRINRFGFFVSPNFKSMGVPQIEAEAATQARQIIDASAAFGFKALPSFCGGRGFAAAMAKWSAWPKYFPEWVLALLASKWNPILEYAADRGVTVTYEIGHPENDILTGQNFVTFWNLLSEKARKGVGVLADASHFLNVGIDPMPHFRAASEHTGCMIANHYKGGASVDHGDGNASVYGGLQTWAEASTSFYTFATVGSESIAREFHSFNVSVNESQGVNPWYVVYEGECVGLANPKQAMKVGAANCRAAIEDTPFIRLDGIIDVDDFPVTTASKKGPVRIVGADGQEVPMDPWDGGPFDAFADSPVKPYALLEMTVREIESCRSILEVAGLQQASRA